MEYFTENFRAMGCPCSIVCSGGSSRVRAKAIAAAKAEIARIEGRYSRYDPKSLLSGINVIAAKGGECRVDSETLELLQHAQQAWQGSNGRFDVTSGVLRGIWNDARRALPDQGELEGLCSRIGFQHIELGVAHIRFRREGMELDLGGIAKEYAADRAAEILQQSGCPNGFVNLGGDIAISGPQGNGAPWQIAVADPQHRDGVIATLALAQGGLATSGNYERFWMIEGRRFSHIFDPKTGWPLEVWPSVTVAAATCLDAGLMATTALLMGEGAAQFLAGSSHAYLGVDPAGTFHTNINLAGSFGT